MDELQPLNEQPAPQRYTPQERCGYCGAPLNPFFYFCTACGTPYKDLNTVVTPDRPRQLTEGELIRMKAPAVWPLFWTYAAVIIGMNAFAVTVFGSQDQEQLMLLAMGALFVTTCVWAAIYWQSLVTQFKQIGFLHWGAWAAIALLAPTLGVNWLWGSMWQQLIDPDKVMPMSNFREDWSSMGMLIFCFCVFPAITEEIAFRGLLQHWLQTAIKPWRAILLASFLFAAMHLSITGFPYLFLVGMLLGWAKWKTGSLYPSMLIHFLHNLVVVVWF